MQNDCHPGNRPEVIHRTSSPNHRAREVDADDAMAPPNGVNQVTEVGPGKVLQGLFKADRSLSGWLRWANESGRDQPRPACLRKSMLA